MPNIELETDTGRGVFRQTFGDSPEEQGRVLQIARLHLRGGAKEVRVSSPEGVLYTGTTKSGKATEDQAQGFPSQASGYEDGLSFSGSVASDIASFLQTADRTLTRAIFETPEGNAVLDVLPYGPAIKTAYGIRQAATGQETYAQRQAREEGEREATQRSEREAGELAASAEEQRRQSEEAGRQARELDDLITEAQNVTRGARKGDKLSRLRLIAIKKLAGEGDPASRRKWKAYTLIADEDQMRIEQGAKSG